MELQVTIGDLAQTRADCLATLVNPGGAWHGAVDNVIRQTGAWHSHINLNILAGSTAGHVHLVSKFDVDARSAPWNYIAFIVDDLQLPLSALVEKGVRAAELVQCNTVAFPAMRMGKMRAGGPPGEQDLKSKCSAIVQGVLQASAHVRNVDIVKLVIYEGDVNRDQIFPLCEAAAKDPGMAGQFDRPLRCIQI